MTFSRLFRKLNFSCGKIPRGSPYFYPSIVIRSLLRIQRSDFTRGEYVVLFEQKFAEYFGVRFAVAFPYARTGLYYLLKSFNFPSGSEVITTPITIPHIINSIILNSLKPVFVDLSANSGNIDVKGLQKSITKKTKCILVTHLNGASSDMDSIMKISKQNNLVVLEDVSQSIGAKYKDIYMGCWGQASIFSISTLKALSTFIGGMVLTNNRDLAIQLRKYALEKADKKTFHFLFELLREWLIHLLTNKYIFALFTFYGIKIANYFLTDFIDRFQYSKNEELKRLKKMPEEFLIPFTNLQAKIGLELIERLDQNTIKRVKLARLLYSELAKNSVSGLIKIPEESLCTFWRFPLWVENPKRFRKYLFDRFIDTTVSGLNCCSREPIFSDFNKETPEAFNFMDNMIFLPIHSNMDNPQIKYIAKVVQDYYKKYQKSYEKPIK